MSLTIIGAESGQASRQRQTRQRGCWVTIRESNYHVIGIDLGLVLKWISEEQGVRFWASWDLGIRSIGGMF